MLFLQSVKGPELKTILRLLPLVLVILVPMGPLDTLLLEAHYSLRGPKEIPHNFQVEFTDKQISYETLDRKLSESNLESCLLVNQEFEHPLCASINLNSLYTKNSVLDLRPKIEAYLYPDTTSSRTSDESWDVYYFKSFAPGLPAPSSASSTPDLTIFLPQEPLPPYRFETPIGDLLSHEIFLNLSLNALQRTFLEKSDYITQITLSFLLCSIFVLFLYQFPIWIGSLVLIGVALTYYFFSLIFFDQFLRLIPTAGPIICLIASYLFVATDQLSKREEKQWHLEHDASILRELDELKSNFLSLISHDLKTPIARMQALLEQLTTEGEDSISQSNNNLISKALSANEQLQRTISTLLLLNRIESREFSIQRSPTDLPKLIEELLKGPKEMARSNNVRIETELEPMFLVDLDASLIREVIFNLVDNALKYSPQGSTLKIRCGDQDHMPELSPPQAGVWIEVQDQGPGIAPEDRDKVLQMFYRSEASPTPKAQASKGSGLGLYLSAFFVEQHSGQVILHSRCQNEAFEPDSPAAEYFEESSTGTLVRVALPLESLYDEAPNGT